MTVTSRLEPSAGPRHVNCPWCRRGIGRDNLHFIFDVDGSPVVLCTDCTDNPRAHCRVAPNCAAAHDPADHVHTVTDRLGAVLPSTSRSIVR